MSNIIPKTNLYENIFEWHWV